MKIPKPPNKAKVTTEAYKDFLGNLLEPGGYVIVGQRDGNQSRMWLGECFGVAVEEHNVMRWDGVPPTTVDANGYKVYNRVPAIEYTWYVLIAPVRPDAYSTYHKHQWETEDSPLTGKAEFTGKRPAPRWMLAKHVVWVPKEIA